MIAGLLLQVVLIAHAVQTRRDRIWVYVLILLPVAGALAYMLVELVPEFLGTRRVRRTLNTVSSLADPDARMRELLKRSEIANTVENKKALADEYIARGRAAEAVSIYRDLLQGIHKTEPDLMLGLATAAFRADDFATCLVTLDALRAANPDFHSADGHLLYAQSLERLGRPESAEREYAALVDYHTGAEAAYRYGLLLQSLGREDAARLQFIQIMRYFERSSTLYKEENRSWYNLAKEKL
jgi:hypothetical protein